MDVSSIGKKFSVNVCERHTDSDCMFKVAQGIEVLEVPSNIEVGAGFDPTLLRRVVDQIKSTFDMLDTRLHFRVNMQANNVVVEVVDSKTNAVIRQIPSEEMQQLKKKIEKIMGALVDIEA